MKSRRPRSFQKTAQLYRTQNVINCPRNFQHRRKRRTRRRIQIEKHIVRSVLRLRPARPRVMVDATQIRQVQNRRQIVRHDVRHLPSALLRIHRRAWQPFRNRFRCFLLKKCFLSNAVGIPPQHQRPVLEKRQHQLAHAKIVGQQIPLSDSTLRKIHFVQMR